MEGERGTVDELAVKYPGMWLAVLLDEPGGRLGTLLVASFSREEAGRAVMEYATRRKPVYFGRAPGGAGDTSA